MTFLGVYLQKQGNYNLLCESIFVDIIQRNFQFCSILALFVAQKTGILSNQPILAKLAGSSLLTGKPSKNNNIKTF